MKIISVTLRNCRMHRELKVDFDSSRTLIGGPNETGKSTLIEAMHRALFLKAKGNTELHRAMISTLFSGHPEVEMAFEAGGKTYLLKKRFGSAGTTTLAPSDAVQMSGDAAETELARILSVEAGISGKAATIQWAHLWVWQGQAGDDPSPHATTQQHGLLQRLQQMGGAAALQSNLDARVAKHFVEAREEIFTQAGKPKAGSELEKAESAVVLAQTELALASERVLKLDSAAADLESASTTLLTSSGSLVDLEKQLTETEAKARQLAELRQQEAEQAPAAKDAASKHSTLDAADKQILKVRGEITEIEENLKPLNEAIARLEIASQEAKANSASAETACSTASEAVRAARIRRDLAAAHTLLFEKAEIQAKLAEKHKKVLTRREDLAGLEEQLAMLPKVDKAKLNKIQKLDSEYSNARAALKAMAAGLEVLASDQPVKVGEGLIQSGQQQILTEETEVVIGSAIRLRIQPGGGTNLAEARKAETEAKNDLQEVLDSLGIQSVKQAQEANAGREDFASRIKAAEAELGGMGAESLAEDLQNAQNDLTAARSNVDRLADMASDVPAPKDKLSAQTLVKTLDGKLSEAEAQETEANATRNRSAKAFDAAEVALNEKRMATEKQKSDLTGLNARLDFLVQTHGDDEARGRALIDCQAAKLAAQALLKTTNEAIAVLQPELIEGDRTRLARAIKERTTEQNEARTLIAVAQAALRSDGSEDPTAGLAIAEARARNAGEHLNSVRRKAEAIELLNQFFQDEQRSLAEQFTQPLADKISGYLQCIFGVGVHVQVDLEDNEFTGLRLSRPGFGNAPFAFQSLSGGAREQAAAAVRLAMAEVLAADYDGCLPVIFDDAFAYSDPERVIQLQRMLDLAAARGLQVIVLSCNPTDYAGLGAKTVALRTERFAPFVPDKTGVESNGESIGGALVDGEKLPSDEAGCEAVTDELRQSLLDTLANLGGSKGNIALREELGWEEAIYNAVKDDLVAARKLMPGKGRGGSVSLPNNSIS